jgi:hypothetical protein
MTSSAPETRAARALTPKEFAEAIGQLLSAYTIREKCRSGELPTVNGPGRPPYFIPFHALGRYRTDIRRFLISQ